MKYESAVENGGPRTLIAGDTPSEAQVRPKIPFGKRVLDLAIAIPALFFVSPLMLLIGVLIRLQDGGPMFFIQKRRGLGGFGFLCMKFRTMRPDAEEILKEILANDPVMAAEWKEKQKFDNDPRITWLGQFLRRTSLDELPQLMNIIRGEMSVVGPRPIVANEVPRYGDAIKAYDSVLPGVTGLWQVNGRSETTYEERVALDVEYVEGTSLMGDIWILLRTVPAVLFARGAK